MVNYRDCVYYWYHKLNPGWQYVGRAKDFNRRNTQHLNNVNIHDGSEGFDKVFVDRSDWDYRILEEGVDDLVKLKVLEAFHIQTMGLKKLGLNLTWGDCMKLKDNLMGSRQLDLYGGVVKSWDLPWHNSLFSLNGVKARFKSAKPHIDCIPSLIDITDFYEPFAGAANISKHLANNGRFHDDLTLHLNDGNLLNYYRLRAVKESPDELVEGLQSLVPDNSTGVKRILNGIKRTKSEFSAEESCKLEDIRCFINDQVGKTDFSRYSIDNAIKCFAFFSNEDHHVYYMFNGDSNLNKFNSFIRMNDWIITKSIYDGSLIYKFSEFLNYYNTVITGLDYKDLVFGDPVDSYIYCDSPYPDSLNSSTMISIDEYKCWLSDLYGCGYNYTLSCNHDAIGDIFKYLNDNGCKCDYKHLETFNSNGNVYKAGDGVLSTFRSSFDVVNHLPYVPRCKGDVSVDKSVQGKLC
jgi:site-specific DNA-adenine methylase